MIEVNVKRAGIIYAPEQYQYNKKQKLKIVGEVPEEYVVEFYNKGDSYPKSTETSVDGVVPIPDECFADGREIICFVTYHCDPMSIGTFCTIQIPIRQRPPRMIS